MINKIYILIFFSLITPLVTLPQDKKNSMDSVNRETKIKLLKNKWND